MSAYQTGRKAYRDQLPADHARHWPTASREEWERGWREAQLESGTPLQPPAAADLPPSTPDVDPRASTAGSTAAAAEKRQAAPKGRAMRRSTRRRAWGMPALVKWLARASKTGAHRR